MFIHLSCASAFSFKYGTAQPRQLVERAAQFGAPALAITDRDSLAGVIRFVQATQELGIAPIVGINLALDKSNNKSRVTLLAQSDGGWRSLCRLLSALREDRKNSSAPILNLAQLPDLSQYTKNLILLHGPESSIADLITKHRSDLALIEFNKYRAFFAESVIECTSHLVAGDGQIGRAHV